MTDLTEGAYEHIITRGIELKLAAIDRDLVDRAAPDSADSHQILSRHLTAITERALKAVAAPRVVQLDDFLSTPAELLTAIVPQPPAPAEVTFPVQLERVF